jgi:glutaredoxin
MFQWLSRHLSKPIKRSPARQREVDEQTRHLTLYVFKICPYCIKVKRVIRQLNLHIEHRDAASSAIYENELRQGGGKMQTPCLKIQISGEVEWLYESDEIIRYLRQNFATSKDRPEQSVA